MVTRNEAIRLLEEQHAEVARLLAQLDLEAFVRRGTIGGGEWSAKDLAAHLGSWEEFSLATLDAFGRGERPAIEDALADDGGTDRVNEQEVERFLHAPAPDVMSRFEDLHRRVTSAIDAMSDQGWSAPYPFDPENQTIGDKVGSLLGSGAGGFTHAAAHLPDLRAYVDSTRR